MASGESNGHVTDDNGNCDATVGISLNERLGQGHSFWYQ